MEVRSDYQNLPGELGSKWPKDAGYAVIDNRFIRDKDEIFDFIKDQKITGFCVVAGDRHAFHAGLASKALPPKNMNHWAWNSLPVLYRSKRFSKYWK
jgi:alkaline phosphatase D